MKRSACAMGVVGILSSVVLAACGGNEGAADPPHARVERTPDGLRAFVETPDGEVLATLDYVRADAQARWATRANPNLAPALQVIVPDEDSARDLALSLWRATERAAAGKVPATSTSVRPTEIFYGAKPPEPGHVTTCTPYSACEQFYGGFACVQINADCSGSTWITL